jgi:hypothetical protein
MSFIGFFNENVNKPEMKELSDLIFKYYKDIMKIKKYTQNVKQLKEDKSKDVVKEKIVKNKKESSPKISETSEVDSVDEKKTSVKKKKEKIPAAVRKIVWNTYIGKDKSVGKCLCCDAEDISNTNFECGHIKSEKNGGEVTVENLRPICGHCNKSISGNNMDEFMDRYKIKKPSNWNGIN